MAAAGAQSASEWNPDMVANSIRTGLRGLLPLSDCCIFTIPKTLRQTNEEAYTPHVIAIGPYHHFDKRLRPMENHKLLYLQEFLPLNPEHSLEDYIQEVNSLEDRARKSYDRQIDLNSNDFTTMMLLDSAFVIQLLLMHADSERQLPNDPIFGRPSMLTDVCRDMALLENQIPFFIVQQLFSKVFEPQQPRKLLEPVCSLFNPATGMKRLPQSVTESKVNHLVDVIRFSFLQYEKMPENNSSSMEETFAPRATDLVAGGVKLKKSESEYLLNIEFKDGVLKIPQLVLCDLTKYYFRNIIALEQCHHKEDRYLIDYMVFMDHLVDTSSDAKLLINEGIILHQLSNEQAVADLINTFGKEVTLSEPRNYFNSLSHELLNHCKKPHNRWKATFERDYCSSPWVVISVIAAVVLLLLTVVQTVCSVLSLK